jgi:amino acid transporter
VSSKYGSQLICMASEIQPAEKDGPHLLRRFGLVQAAALNMSNMIGVGPFITIPLLMSALGGPQAMLGWIVAVLIAIPDGMVWSELGAAMPGSGGSYLYLREGFGRETFGRFVAFLFIWQFILSGPLEIASGYIGFARYTGYIWPNMTQGATLMAAAAVGVINIVLLYRRITSIGTITVSLWIGTLGAFTFSLGFVFGLGAASRVGVYDYLGYYDICYIGDEVKDPGRTIPRSIIISVIAVAVIYLAINLSVIGIVPWRDFVPWDQHPESGFLVSTMMEKIYGTRIATIFTAMVLWTAFGSVFALLLGYSRIPYAAALDGYFFRVFGRLHPTKRFPYVSLIVLGLISIICSFFSLDTVIDALISTRILVQFIGQILALILLRKHAPNMPRPYKMWLYPLPCLVALIGWIFIFATTAWPVMLLGLGTLSLGAIFFVGWSWYTSRWPFAADDAGAR